MKLEQHDIDCKFCETKSIVLTKPEDEVEVNHCPLCGAVIDEAEDELE